MTIDISDILVKPGGVCFDCKDFPLWIIRADGIPQIFATALHAVANVAWLQRLLLPPYYHNSISRITYASVIIFDVGSFEIDPLSQNSA